MGYSMARFTLSVAPDANMDNVTKIINKIGLQLAGEEEWKNKILEAPQFVNIGNFNATSVDIIITGKTQPSDQWSVVNEMRKRLLAKFEAEGIGMGVNSAAITTTQPKKR